jgi:hypothetical protein
MVNFRTNVLISVYHPTIVACDVGLGLAVHYSGKYFMQVNFDQYSSILKGDILFFGHFPKIPKC